MELKSLMWWLRAFLVLGVLSLAWAQPPNRFAPPSKAGAMVSTILQLTDSFSAPATTEHIIRRIPTVVSIHMKVCCQRHRTMETNNTFCTAGDNWHGVASGSGLAR